MDPLDKLGTSNFANKLRLLSSNWTIGLFNTYCHYAKQFALCYRTVVLSACLSVTLVHCGQTDQDETWHAGRPQPGHIVLDGDPAPTPPKGHSPQFSAHICCVKMAAWIKVPIGTEVRLGPGDFVIDGYPAPSAQKGGGASVVTVSETDTET